VGRELEADRIEERSQIWHSMRRFIDWWIPHRIREAGGRDHHRARLLASMMFLGGACAACAAIGHALFGSPLLAAVSSAVFLLEFGLLFSLRIAGRIELLIFLSISIVFSTILVVGYHGGGWASVQFRWITVIPLVATFLGGRAAGIRWTGLSLLSMLAFAVIEAAGITFPESIPPAQKTGAQFIALFLLQVFILGIAFLFDEMKDFSVSEVEKVNLALEHEVAERRLVESELRSSQMLLAEGERVAHIGSWHLDLVTLEPSWSEELYHIFGMEGVHLSGNGTVAFPGCHPEDRDRLESRFFDALRDLAPFEVEYRVVLPGGTIRRVRSEGHVEWDASGTPSRMYGVVQDITERKRAEEELARLHEQLVVASHESGMAEVATGILHNMGNVLTTLNTSASMIAARSRPSGIEGLRKAAEMVEKNRDDLTHFFSEEPIGIRFPAYFRLLADNLQREREELADQVGDLRRSIDHINMIIGLQQTYARGSTFRERVRLPDLIEESIRLAIMSGKEQMRVESEIEELISVVTDRHRVLQILVTLVRNAIDAVRERASRRGGVEYPEWGVRINLRREESDSAVIEVRDEGVGISAENMERIFSFGFTTKKQGHGFGLHNAALVAGELGGSLAASSEGPGFGATFTLTLPMESKEAPA